MWETGIRTPLSSVLAPRYNSPQFNQSDVVVGLAVPGSAPSPAATLKEVA